jgi:uncharacterized YigZ family protein
LGPSPSYITIAGPSRAELREKGSRFLAFAEPVADETAVRERLDDLKRRFPDATHVCWAARTGIPARSRSSDAGEPRGTAGPPILRALDAAQLDNVLVAVVRWFGGTKLGKGGLARAYAEAARSALAGAQRIERIPQVLLRAECGWGAWGAVQRLVHPPAVVLRDACYGERVQVTLAVECPALAGLCEQLRSLGVSVVEPR